MVVVGDRDVEPVTEDLDRRCNDQHDQRYWQPRRESLEVRADATRGLDEQRYNQSERRRNCDRSEVQAARHIRRVALQESYVRNRGNIEGCNQEPEIEATWT